MRAPALSLSLLALAILALPACTSGPGPADNTSYTVQLQQERVDKDRMLRTGKDSPIPAADRATFPGLPYFDVNPAFRVAASLRENRATPPLVIEMQQTDGKTEQMRKVGALVFSLRGVDTRSRRLRDQRHVDGPPVRAVWRSHERRRHLQGRPVPESRADADQALRSRLQSRLPSVLRRVTRLDLPGSTA
jgi:hypothetical protein